MADDTGLPDMIAAVTAALKTFKTGLLDVSTVASQIIRKDVSAATSTGLKSGLDDSTTAFDDFTRTIEKEFGDSTEKGMSTGLQQAFNIGEQMLTKFRDSLHNGLSQMKATVGLVAGGFDPHSLESLGRSVGDFMENRPVSIGLVLSEDSIRRVVDSSRINQIERKMTDFTKNVGPALTQFSSDSIDLGDNIEGAMTQASDSMSSLGTSSQENIQYIQALSAAGLNLNKTFGEEFTVKLNTGDALPNLNALATAQTLARGSGLEMNAVVNTMRDSMRSLGYSASEAVNVFGTFKQVQQDSGLPISDIQQRLMESAKSLRFFGGNVETVAATYKTFIQTLGEGKQALALEVSGDVVQGLAGMNFGNKAFLGMTGSIGGQGGAVGSGLRVEKALETGEGLEGIIQDLKDTLMRSTGTGLLTRDTAIATGQEQQFLAQRQISGQFLGISDPGKLNTILETFASSRQVRTEDLKPGREAATQTVAETGRKLIDQTMGPLEQSLNRLSGLNLQSIRQMHTDFTNLNTSAQTFAKNFLEPLRDVLGGKISIGGKSGDEFFTGAKAAPDVVEREKDPRRFGAPALLPGETAANQPIALGGEGFGAPTPLTPDGPRFGLRPLETDNLQLTPPQLQPFAATLRPPTEAAANIAQEKIEERTLKLKVMSISDEIQTIPVHLQLHGTSLSLEPLTTDLMAKMKHHVQLVSDDLARPE